MPMYAYTACFIHMTSYGSTAVQYSLEEHALLTLSWKLLTYDGMQLS